MNMRGPRYWLRDKMRDFETIFPQHIPVLFRIIHEIPLIIWKSIFFAFYTKIHTII